MSQGFNLNQNQFNKDITKLAIGLYKNNEFYSRADVAAELKSKGIKEDSSFVEELIYRAHEAAKNRDEKRAIETVFYNNQLTKPLIDAKSVKNIIRTESFDNAIVYFEQKAQNVNQALLVVVQDVERLTEKAQNFIAESKLLSSISGASQVDKVKNEAAAIYKDYEKLILYYREAERSIKDLIEDFSLIRAELIKSHRENITRLTDIFGTSIKAIEPKLFDYNLIEFIDTTELLENTQYKFDKLIKTCKKLIVEINTNFVDGISKATRVLGRGNRNEFGIALLGLELLNSWADSADKATVLKLDLEKLKQEMNYDATKIKADLGRLQIIDKILCDRYIPAANTFRQYSKDVMTSEIENLLDSIYAQEDIKNLKKQKDELMNTYNSLEIEIIDHQNQSKYYTDKLSANEIELKEIRPLYLKAQQLKPKKPFFLFNLFSLGNLKKSYNRDVAEWSQEHLPIIEAYCEKQEDINMDIEELNSHEKAIKPKKVELNNLQKEIDKHSEFINNKIQSNSDVQVKLAKHLAPLVNLLRTSRQLIELKIDKELLTSVRIQKVEFGNLPIELEKKITEITTSLKQKSSERINKFDIHQKLADKEEFDAGLDNKESHAIVNQLVQESSLKIVTNTIDLIENTLRLKKLKLDSAYASQKYDDELNKLRSRFKELYLSEEKKEAALREVIKTINTGHGIEVREALIELIDDNDWITESEVINLLKHKKNITI